MRAKALPVILISAFLCGFTATSPLSSSPSPSRHTRSLSSGSFSITNRIGCSACKGLGAVVLGLVRLTGSARLLRTKAKIFCPLVSVSEAVCKGYVDKWAAAITYIVTHTDMGASDLCSLYLPSCPPIQLPIDISLSLPGHRARRTLTALAAPSPREQNYPSPRTRGLRVLHLADIHLDLQYTEGADNVCDDVLCCRADNGFPSAKHRQASRWGEYRRCDVPYGLLQSAIKHAAENNKDKLDYILWTGDNAPHDIWRSTREEVIDTNANITQLLMDTFPGVPVIPVIGNHDTVPNDGFPPPEVWRHGFSIAWLYGRLADMWRPWLTADAAASLGSSGYYSMVVKPGFRIIVVNTIVAYKFNFWVVLTARRDPYRHLQWLAEELHAAQRTGEKVHIVGHISPGDPDILPDWSHRYHQIIQSYQDTVLAQFFSHTHRDEMLLSKDSQNRPFCVTYVAPSLTPFTDKNPGYKVYTVDGARGNKSTWEVTEVTRYTVDLEAANAHPNQGPRWTEQYKASEVYNLPNLSPGNWARFFHKLLYSEKEFRKYYRYLSGSSPVQDICDQKCRQDVICDILSSDRSNSFHCSLASIALRVLN